MRRTTWLVSMVLLAGVNGCASTSGSTSPAASLFCDPRNGGTDALRILVLGDSIAAGSPLGTPERWSDRLEATLRIAKPDRIVEVRNVAISGSKIDFLESSINARPDLATYGFAIVFEGVNDVGITPIDEWKRRFTAAIERLEKYGLAIIIGTAPSTPVFVDDEFEGTYDELAATQRSIADEHGRLPLDIERNWRDLGAKAAGGFYVDPIHQAAAGQVVMADLAARLILTLPGAC